MAKKPKTSKSSTENASAVSALELEWEDIDPAFFAGARSQAPTYPIEVLPQRFGSTVSAVAQARCVNIDFVASSLIAIASGAVGNRVRLAITARRTEPGVIFMACLLYTSAPSVISANLAIASKSFETARLKSFSNG